MSRTLLRVLAATTISTLGYALLAAPALAAAPFLAWSECGPAGQSWKTFACNTNVGESVLVASFTAPPGISQFIAAETTILFHFPNSLQPWWQLRNQGTQTGQCRNGSISADAAFTANGLNACTDVFNVGGVLGGIGSYQVNSGGDPHRARLLLVFQIPASVPLVTEQHYYAARVRINHALTAGVGSCSGCLEPALAFVERIRVVQPQGAPGGNVDLFTASVRNQTTPIPSTQIAGWQCPGTGHYYCGSVFCDLVLNADCSVTPVHSSTWGAVKSLYR